MAASSTPRDDGVDGSGGMRLASATSYISVLGFVIFSETRSRIGQGAGKQECVRAMTDVRWHRTQRGGGRASTKQNEFNLHVPSQLKWRLHVWSIHGSDGCPAQRPIELKANSLEDLYRDPAASLCLSLSWTLTAAAPARP